MTSPKGILKQTSWYALEMFARFMHGAALDIAVISPKWDALANGGTPDRPWAAFVCKDAFTWIDATASIVSRHELIFVYKRLSSACRTSRRAR